jgi:hypothetical protein
MKRQLVALYKAFTGGEWFGASLESIAPFVDGVVVVFSAGPWMPALQTQGDCEAPLEKFRQDHPGMKVVTRRREYHDQQDQYYDGLEAVREEFDDETAVLIIDTDEVWESGHIKRLADALRHCEDDDAVYRCHIRTYVKSPLYQVFPHETAFITVGLASAKRTRIRGRFQTEARTDRSVNMPSVWFHHFPYVRENEVSLREKFMNTGSQEDYPSDFTWWDRVWPNLPDGKNIHMSKGCEHCWVGMRVVTPDVLPAGVLDIPWVRSIVDVEQHKWRKKMMATPPADAIIPQPNTVDERKYRDRGLPADLLSRAKTSVLETLLLIHYGAHVPEDGVILEIGSGSGGSMAALQWKNSTAKLISVDPFLPYDEENSGGVARGVTEGNEKEFWETAERFGYTGRIATRKELSHDAVSSIDNKSIDLLLVDGNHSKKECYADCVEYWPKLKPGGIMLVHDYTTRFPGVISAVEEWSPDNGGVAVGTSMFIMVKE